MATNPFLQDPLTKLATDLEAEAAQPLPGQQAAAPAPVQTEVPQAKTTTATDAPAAPATEAPVEGRRPTKTKSMLPPPQFQPTFDAAAKQYNVPVNVLMALGQQESGYNATIIGQPTKWGRAKGMMQYLDSTAAGLGINPLNPDESIGAAAKQLRERLDKGYSMEDAVKEHFAGPDRKLWGAKTAAYGREVMQKTAQIGDLLGASTGATAQSPELQQQLDAEEPGRYKVLPAGYAQNNQSAAMPRDTYLRTFRQNNPNASPAAIEQAMAQYDKTKARAPATQGITVPDSPEAFFDQRLNQRLQGPANGIVPGLPGVLTRQQQDDADFLNIGTKTNAPTGVAANAADVGKGLKVGLNTAAQDVRELVGRIPVIGQPIVRGGDAVDQFFTGKDSGKLLADDSKAMTESMTPEMQSALKKKWYDSESGKMGPAWSDWRSYTGGLVQSLPEQALTMGPAMKLAKMAYASKIAAGATAEVAALSAARTAQVAGSLAEGALGGAQSAREVREDVMALPPEVLAQSDAFKSLVASGLSPADAQKALAEDVATRAFVTSGLVTGAFGGMGDRAIAKLFAEKIGKSAVAGALKGFGKGAIAEGLFEELPQSMGQRLSQNEAMQKADPTRALSDDVINQGLGGAVLGGLQGGGMGAVAGARGGRQAPAPAPAPENQQPAPEAPPVVPPSQMPVEPADSAPPAPSSSKPLTDALNGAAEHPQRVVVDTPGGPVAGTLQGYQENEQGGFTAQVVDDNGQVVTISDTDGVQITPVAPPAGPLTSAIEQAAEEHAAAQPEIEATAKTLMDSETEKAKILTDEELRNAVAQQTNAGVAPESAAPPVEATPAPEVSPEPVATAEPAATPIAEMSDAELRKRLKYIAGQAKQSGWDKRFMEARREIEREINQRADVQKTEAAAAAVIEPTEFTDRADANAAMLRAAERENKVYEVVESGDKFKIQPLAEVKDAPGTVDGNGRRGSDRAAGSNEPAVGNGSVPVGDAGRRLSDVGTADRADEQRDAAGVPAADRAAVADAPLKDAHAGKWFSSQEKADVYVAKKKIGPSHEVVKTGKVRFEVKPRAAEPAIPSNSGELEASPVPDLAGKKIDKEWTAFAADSGTLNIDRAEMPQVKAEHRGALVNYLNARGIAHEQAEVAAGDLKPTQREFSPGKVAKAKAFDGGDRSILISSDNHVLDGHHQWLAKREDGAPVKVIRLDAPIKQLLDEVKDFPSAQAAAGATASGATPAAKVPDLAPSAQAPAVPAKKMTGKAAATERARQLADYFTPGNIVKGYGGYDRVIAFEPDTERGGMNVRVQAVEKKDGQWVPVKNERERNHSTIPSEREMKTGVVERAPTTEKVPDLSPFDAAKEAPLAAVRDTSGKTYETKGEPLPAKGVAPANIGSNGIAYIGKPNSQHFQIAMDHPTSERGAFLDTGFVTPDGQYLSREEALAWVNENEKAVKPTENMGGQLDALDYRDQVPQSSRKGKGTPAAPAKKASASKPRKPAAAIAQEEAPAAPIADFGEKIEGARKDLWATYKTEMKGELPADVKEITLAKHFPEPNYDALIAEGVDVKVLAALKAMRDEIPAKPRMPYKAKRWGEQVTALRSFANDLLDGKYTADTLLTKMRTTDSGALRKFADRIQMYAEVGYPAFRQAKGYNLTSNSYSLFAGKEYKPHIVKFDLTKDGRTVSYFDSWDEAVGALKSLLSAAPAPAASRATKLDMYRLSNGEIVIGKKVAAGKYIDLKGGFKDVRTARDYLRENEAELAKLLEAKKDVRPERRSINTPRVGKDMRLGEDITPEKFGETFGFRGVQFGNYVEQKRRAADLNNAYDALQDMAEITGLPPAAISLDGSLGLAFGARGAGGKNAAAAHYEPGNVVINLTKTNGAGSLGHEWWHALDNYFSRKRGDIEGFVSAKPTVRKKAGEGRTLVDDDSIRPEALEAFNGVVSAIQASGMPKRSSVLDARRTKDYWSTIHELTARAFESYLIDKAAEKGGSNDYLANIVSEDAHKAMDEMTGQPEPFPYPTREEAPAINAAFDKLFEVMKTETTDKGTALYSVSGDIKQTEMPAFKRWFGESKAVDAEGKPLIVYHGTARDFSEFRVGIGGIGRRADTNNAIFLSNDPRQAEFFARMESRRSGDGERILPVYVTLQNPLIHDFSGAEKDGEFTSSLIQKAKADGRDGVILRNVLDAMDSPPADIYVAFSPAQIKSATGNNGSFDPTDPDIRKSVGTRSGSTMTTATLRAAVTDGALGPVVGSLIDAGLIVLHETPATLPRNVGNQAQGIQAVTTPDGKVHLIASALSAGNARAVMLHEAFHQGGEKLIGTQEWDALMRRAGQLYRQANQSQGKAKEFFDKARERVYSAYRKGAVEPHMEVEEFAAYAIEEYESAPATVRKWIDDLIGMVKAWALKRFGKQLGALTPAQLSALAKMAVLDVAATRRGEVFGKKGDWFSVGKAELFNVVAALEKKYSGLKLDVMQKRNSIEISRIVLPKEGRGQGAGTAAMKSLIEYADKAGIPLSLTPSSDFGGSLSRLKEFYKALGFIENKGKNKDFEISNSMYRPPSRSGNLFSVASHATSEAFKRWFGASKIVDSSGAPIVVYHGSGEDIEAFRTDGEGKRGNGGKYGQGAYFTPMQDMANHYADKAGRNGGDAVVYPVYLSVKNPLLLSDLIDRARWAGQVQAGGLSGAIAGIKLRLSNARADGIIIYDGNGEMAEVVVFDPSQVKSAIGNDGSFDPNNKGMRYSVAEETRADPAPAPSPTPTPGPAPTAADLTPPEQGRFRKMQAALQNNMNRVRQVQDRIEQLTGAKMSEATDHYGADTNRPGRVAARLEDAEKKLVNPLMMRLAKSKHTPEQLSELLHAMHAQERNEKIAEFNQNMPDGGSGMTTAEADRILDKYAAARELHAIADQAREIAKATLDLKLAYGLINDEDHKQLSEVYDNYVPLKGDGEFGPKIKRAMGHEEREEHILENLSRDYNQAVIVGEKNLARQSLLRMVLANPDPELWTVGVPPRGRRIAGQTFLIKSGGETIASFNTLSQATAFAEGKGGNVEITDTKGERIQEYVRPLQDNEVMVYVKGSPVRIQIYDEKLASQLRPLDQGKMNPILEFMRGTNRYLSKIYTGYNPAFILRNATRDAMTGTISMLGNNGAAIAAKAWSKYPGAVKALGVWAATGKTPDGKTGAYLTEYRMHGGKVGASWMSDLEANGKKLSTMYEDAYGATNYAKDGRPTKAAIVAGRKIVGGMAHIVEIANQATENGLRLSLYIAMREKGATPGKAAQAAKTVTVDFDRKGTMTGTLSAIYLFFNPAVQGSANALKTLVKGEHKQQAWAALGSLALLGAYLASRGMDDDKDRWLGEGWETRSKNMIWNVGGHQIRVPVSQEYAPAFSLGMALSEAAHGESKMKASARIVSAFLDAYFPLQGAHIDGSDNPAMDLSLAATPTMLKPFAQSAANRSSFGGQVVPENTMTKDRPDNLKMFRGTKNSLYDKAAQNIASFGELTGAGKYENDITKVSPETLKMLWRTYTGGLGTFVTDSMGVTAMTASDPGQVEASDIPIVKDFWRASDVKPIRGRYYDLTGEARGAITEFEQAKKAGDGEAMEKLFDDPAKAQAVSTGRLVKSVNKAAASIRDGEVDINARTDMTPSEKRAALKDLEKQEEELYRSAIEAFK